MLMLSSADFFQNELIQKIFQEHYKRVKRLASRSGQTFSRSSVCKGYQQTAKVTVNKEKVKLTPAAKFRWCLIIPLE